MLLSPSQCRAARALLDWTQHDLAARSGVSQKAIALFEVGRTMPLPRTLRDLREALEAGGIEFLNTDRPGVRFSQAAVSNGRHEGNELPPDATPPVTPRKKGDTGREVEIVAGV